MVSNDKSWVNPPAVRLVLRNEPSATNKLRGALEEVASACRLGEEECFELKLAATEAFTNAVKAAPADHFVEVAIRCIEGVVDVELTDRGGFVPRTRLDGGAHEAEGGRGIPLMLALADQVEFATLSDGTRVRLRKRRVEPNL
jgi:anti-sigma regulatory factor (Ser/Thr protein kinase)